MTKKSSKLIARSKLELNTATIRIENVPKTMTPGHPDFESSHPSAHSDRPHSFIEQLDAQQNDVMTQLDALNDRIEMMLNQLSQSRESELS